MASIPNHVDLILSLQRALLGEIHPELRAASIQAEPFRKLITVRFEYAGTPSDEAQESGSCAATEVIADFPEPWRIEEEHVGRPLPAKCQPLEHLVYLRHERGNAA
jgi:hypothetical protein